MSAPLPPPPRAVAVDGAPALGRYAGAIAHFGDWRTLQPPYRPGPLWRRLHHKRWHYVGLGDAQHFIGVALVDLGWCCTAFAYCFDRRRRHLLADWHQDGLPGLQGHVGDAPLAGAHAWFRGPGARLSLRHEAGDLLHLQVDTRALRIDARLALAGMAPPLLAIGAIDDGVAHATLKTSALPVQGWAECEGQRFSLDQSVAAVDASNGLLARHTAWRWASAHRADIGFNLQQGYFGAQENALWLDGRLVPLGPAQFDFDAERPLSPWHIRTEDGLLDLVFTPEGARRDSRDLGIAASHYVQPIGCFNGTVRPSPRAPLREVQGLLGVTEDHRSRW